ncbi:MAG: hypothetical protein EOP50_14140 [Sphingobacteriales bacterium]|nr:MAG: hypothetical protein EOP50_14140 [Sphingobacteriales bacterium]
MNINLWKIFSAHTLVKNLFLALLVTFGVQVYAAEQQGHNEDGHDHSEGQHDHKSEDKHDHKSEDKHDHKKDKNNHSDDKHDHSKDTDGDKHGAQGGATPSPSAKGK